VQGVDIRIKTLDSGFGTPGIRDTGSTPGFGVRDQHPGCGIRDSDFGIRDLIPVAVGLAAEGLSEHRVHLFPHFERLI